MKKTLIVIALLIFVTGFIFACGTQGEAHSDHFYAMTAKVVALDYTVDLVTVEDFNGFRWCFYECDDWQIGDCVSIVMHDNDTPLIFDDVIYSVRYGAWELTRRP